MNIPTEQSKAIDLIHQICKHHNIGCILVETEDIERCMSGQGTPSGIYDFCSLKESNLNRIKSKTVDLLMDGFTEALDSAVERELTNISKHNNNK